MFRLAGLIMLAAVVAGASGTAQAEPIIYTAVLSGAAEEPANASPGTGFARVAIDLIAHTLRVQVSFADLLDGTSVAHIHAATAEPGVGVAGVATQTPRFEGFPVGVTSGSYDNTFDTTLASTFNPAYVTAQGGTAAGAEAALASSLAAGTSYFNIHTGQFPAGEIRGFLQAVPEPSSILMTAFGALGLLALGRRMPRSKASSR